MKIAIIHFGRKGAGPVYSLEMAKALHKLGHQIFYYASCSVENKRYVLNNSFNIRLFKTYDSKLSYLKSILYRSTISRVIESIKNDNPDIVYSTMNDLWTPFIFPKLKKFQRIKTIHDVGIHEGNNSLFNKWWNRTNFKDAEKYIILSRKFIVELERRGIPSGNICVIPHAGFDYYKKLDQSMINSSKSNILFFGRIDKYKGIPVLISALRIVQKKYPNVKLNIVGNGDLTVTLSDIKSMDNNICVFNRWIKDEEIASFFNSTDFVVLPYIHATQSGVIPLAYAFSKPVIATNVGSLDEQVIEGETGYLISPNNPKELADAIIVMMADKNKTKEMGENAYRYMMDYLTWDSSAQLFSDFINRKDE